MYCPQCGLQQVNNDVRFCSRCGFQLGGVTELLANQGIPTHQLAANQLPFVAPPGVSQRKKGMKNGAKLMFLSAVLTPIFIGISAMVDDGTPLIVPFTVFLAGLCWLVYSAIFGEDNIIPQVRHYPQPFNAPPVRSALPNAENYQVAMPPPRINTAEMVNQPSVTDHTTQLFDKE